MDVIFHGVDGKWRDVFLIIATEVTETSDTFCSLNLRVSKDVGRVIPGIVSYDSELVVAVNLNVSSYTSARNSFLNSGTGAREMHSFLSSLYVHKFLNIGYRTVNSLSIQSEYLQLKEY